MNKVYFIGAVALLVVLVLGMTFPRSGGTVVERVVDQLGAGSSSATDEMFEEGGLVRYVQKTTMSAVASTTPASWKRLPNATTTIDMARCEITTATGTAGTVGIYLGTTPGATSTATLIEASLAASTKTTLVVASSTIAAPNLYMSFGAKGAPSGFIFGGSCDRLVTQFGK